MLKTIEEIKIHISLAKKYNGPISLLPEEAEMILNYIVGLEGICDNRSCIGLRSEIEGSIS